MYLKRVYVEKININSAESLHALLTFPFMRFVPRAPPIYLGVDHVPLVQLLRSLKPQAWALYLGCMLQILKRLPVKLTAT